MQFEQPEPCLGGPGTHDREGRCYSRIACSVFGFCRERAVQRRGSPYEPLQEGWKAAAKERRASSVSRPHQSTTDRQENDNGKS